MVKPVEASVWESARDIGASSKSASAVTSIGLFMREIVPPLNNLQQWERLKLLAENLRIVGLQPIAQDRRINAAEICREGHIAAMQIAGAKVGELADEAGLDGAAE